MSQAERQPTTFSFVGMLDEPDPTLVDTAGFVWSGSGGWCLEWWVRDGDRWRLPSREPTVRQRRLGPGPVIETVVRVLGGDIAATVHPAPVPGRAAGGPSATVLELENRASTPVAVALVLRSASGDLDRVLSVDPTALSIGDRSACRVLMPRPPAESGVVEVSSEALDAGLAGPGSATAPACAVAVFPLPHTSRLRLVVERGSGSAAVPDDFVERDSVIAGWRRLVEAGGRLVLPDEGIGERADAARARLLLGATDIGRRLEGLERGAGTALVALATGGPPTEVRHAVRAVTGSVLRRDSDAQASAEIVEAVGTALAIVGDTGLAEEVLETLVALGRHADKGLGPTAGVGEGLARAAALAGQTDAAASLRAGRPGEATQAVADFDDLARLAESATSAGSFGPDDLVTAARFWLAVRSMIVSDLDGELDLLPQFPTAWRGGALEVHKLATSVGHLSLAVRWHGFRPALLWSLDPQDRLGAGASIRLRCSALDPEWTATTLTGETLLTGVGDDLPGPPAEGESFS